MANGGLQEAPIQVRRLRVPLEQLLVDAAGAVDVARVLERTSEPNAVRLVRLVESKRRAVPMRSETVRLPRFFPASVPLQNPPQLRGRLRLPIACHGCLEHRGGTAPVARTRQAPRTEDRPERSHAT